MSYRITIRQSGSYWFVTPYCLLITPVYEKGGSQIEPVRVDERWERMTLSYNDRASSYLEARWMAWKLQRKLESGKIHNGEEVIYERKG